MSGFSKIVKEAKDIRKCPVCHTPLKHWGDITDYPGNKEGEMWRCPNCDYERTIYKRLKNDER